MSTDPAPLVTANAIASNLSSVKERIAKAAEAAGRDPGTVTLVAVSKGHGAAAIRAALDAGHRVFGENRVQEAESKWPDLRAAFPGVELHLIGPLQSNKAAQALGLFDVIETVDRPRLAARLQAARERAPDLAARYPRYFVQVNTGEEPQKAGMAPADTPAFVESLRRDFAIAAEGLMCIPPVDEEPALHFALLAKIAARIGLPCLSMGMSQDFETAVAHGATHVRVGTAVFGARAATDPH